MFTYILAPLKAPDLVMAYDSSSTSLIVKWSKMSEDHFRGQPIGYHITYYPDGSEYETNFLSLNHTRNTAQLSNLIVYTVYVINVSAVSSGGIGPTSTMKARTGAEGKHMLKKGLLFHPKQSFSKRKKLNTSLITILNFEYADELHLDEMFM